MSSSRKPFQFPSMAAGRTYASKPPENRLTHSQMIRKEESEIKMDSHDAILDGLLPLEGRL